MSTTYSRSILLAGWLVSLLPLVFSYQAQISDTDYSRQICSGMWADSTTYINVTFDKASHGQLAAVIYEWADVVYLGKTTSYIKNIPKTYICTTDALTSHYCDESQLGRFIIDLPSNMSISQTSFWFARIGFRSEDGTSSTSGRTSKETVSTGGFWDNPDGNPTPPSNENTSPWRRANPDPLNPSSSDILWYQETIHYNVRKTGYYCVGIVPLTVLSSDIVGTGRDSNDVPFHPKYKGTIVFKNKFDGQLPATDHPKVNFYLAMLLAYILFASAWGWLCYQHVQDLLPIQYYLSGLVGFLVVEMIANLTYYRYLNAHGKNTASTVFLFVVAIMDAGRNALSFFMLLVVSLGLSVVRESIGTKMFKCQALTGAHFVFGVLYAVGIVELELELTSALVLLLFVVPLAFTLSGFLLWIMFALNTTMAHLKQRKQRYKLGMFTKLHRILLGAVAIIAIFFVVSTVSFSARFAEDYAANTWKVRWWLLDGWLALLYFAAFVSIAYLWRPSMNNRRYVIFLCLAFIHTNLSFRCSRWRCQTSWPKTKRMQRIMISRRWKAGPTLG
ncbi:hypothetical protein BDM02DRAFT_3239315 [Thelephora ganbajun]|uniref:Uncharacterized protein n=1 Tax=Thelephora ganbajun TaxID=370292 RepID=A0ACB6ZFT6_THEGA|nr:hypothetical protein BDM02DRAFT_3239315 [Thelephora ganbajun]